MQKESILPQKRHDRQEPERKGKRNCALAHDFLEGSAPVPGDFRY